MRCLGVLQLGRIETDLLGAGFLAAEFPTQYLAQRISRLGIYLGLNIMTWGLILGFHAACTTFAGLAIVRTLLGVFESWYVHDAQGSCSSGLTAGPVLHQS